MYKDSGILLRSYAILEKTMLSKIMQCIREGVLDITKILIVEDDLSLSNGIVLALKDSEFAFVQVQDLRSARRETESAVFDLIIWTSICRMETGWIS
jgi:PleD family two-component response regulator